MTRPVRILLRVLLGVVIGLGAVAGIITLVVNLVLTSDRLVPLIKGVCESYLEAEVDVEEAEGTFFSTFPHLGARVRNGVIVTHAFHKRITAEGDTIVQVIDSLRSRKDTLLRFDELVVGLDIPKLLMAQVALDYVKLDHPRALLMTDSLLRSSWDVMKTAEPDTVPEDTTSSSFAINLRHLRINNARVAYFDWPGQLGFFSDSLHLKADGDLSLEGLDADIELSRVRSSLGMSQTRYFRHLPLGFEGHVKFNTDSTRYEVDEGKIEVGPAQLLMDGWMATDTAGMDMDVRYRLASNDVEQLFALIPKEVVSAPIGIKGGSLGFEGTLKGRLAKGRIPVVNGCLKIDQVRAQYNGRPDEIEDATLDFDMYLDQDARDSSFVNLEILHFKGGDNELTASVRAEKILNKDASHIFASAQGHIDLQKIQRVIPFDNAEMGGQFNIDINGDIPIRYIVEHNYGHAEVEGHIEIDSLWIKSPSKHFDLGANAALKMLKGESAAEEQSAKRAERLAAGKTVRANSGTRDLSITCDISQAHLKQPGLTLFVKDGRIRANSEQPKAGSKIVPLSASVKLARAFFKQDSLAFFAKNAKVRGKLFTETDSARRPDITAHLSIDTLFCGIEGTKGRVRQIDVRAALAPKADTLWTKSGSLSYAAIGARAPIFRLPLISTDTEVAFQDEHVEVRKCFVRTGSTSMNASATVDNFWASLKNHKPIVFDIKAQCDTVNINEIMAALISVEESHNNAQDDGNNEQGSLQGGPTPELASAADTTMAEIGYETIEAPDSLGAMRMVLVPKNVRLNLALKAGTLVFDKLRLNNIGTKICTTDGAVHMTGLFFKMGEMSALTTLAYKAWPRTQKARVDVFSYIQKINIGDLVNILGLDTVMPALKPMQGKLDCYLGAEAELDSAMTPNLNTARASLHLGGEKLVVMDNASFAKIAKMLMFKNKERNVIDTLSVNVLLDSGRVQVLPTALSMDRYRLALAGNQDLAMNMSYHVSILKSPLPFKAGVTIKGTPEDFDIDITTAKLKKWILPERLAEYDSCTMKMRRGVLYNSYVLSGLPVPQWLRKIFPNGAPQSQFAVAIAEENATEEELAEAERAKQALKEGGDPDALASDSTAASNQTPPGAPPDSIK